MEDPTATPPSDGQQALTIDQVQGLLQQFNEGITKQINGLAAKLNGRIDAVKGESSATIEKLLSTLTPLAESPDPATEEPAKPTTPADDDPVVKLQAAMARQSRETAKKIQEMEARFQESERKAQRLQAVQDFTRIAGDRLIDPDALVTIAESRGILRQAGASFQVVAGKDEFTGEPIIKPVNEALDVLINAAPYLEKARPGNGTGATAGEPAPAPAPKYNSPDAIMQGIMSGKVSEVIQEIKR
jgi:hypothetical protein